MTDIVAEVAGPPIIVLHIYAVNPGWVLGVERLEENKWVPFGADIWEERLSDLPRYLSRYTQETALVWKDEDTGLPVDFTTFINENS